MCADMVLAPRYGLSLTTIHGVLDGVQREVLVCMGGFREGGVLAMTHMHTHACATSAHHADPLIVVLLAQATLERCPPSSCWRGTRRHRESDGRACSG